MRKLLESDNLTQVELIASYLNNQGIELKILNQHQATTLSANSWHAVWPELWVNAKQFEQAAKLVGRYQFEQEQTYAAASDWACSNCKETCPANFMACWSCGSAK